MKWWEKYLLVLFTVSFFILFSTDSFAQCAMCKQAAESSLKSNPNSLARSLNSGILYLMAVPYVLLGFIFRKQIYKLYKSLVNKSRKSPVKQ